MHNDTLVNSPQKMLLIVNLHSGMMKIKQVLPDIIDLFCKNGFIVNVQTTQYQGHGKLIAKDNAPYFDIIVCCGGDGTLHEIISGIMSIDKRPPIGYIPSGTSNDFARSMNIPLSPIEAAHRIILKQLLPLDIGMFGEYYFLYIASCGAFTDCSYTTPQKTKNTLGHLAYILEGVKQLSNIKPFNIRVETSNETIEGEYIYTSISNTSSIGGFLKLEYENLDFADGLFEVILVKAPKSLSDVQEIISGILLKRYNKDLFTLFQTSSATIYTKNPFTWSLDGEQKEIPSPFMFKIHDKAIHIYA